MKSVSVGLFQHRNGTFYTIKRIGEKQQLRSLGAADKNEALRKLVIQLDVSPAQPEQDYPFFKGLAEQWAQQQQAYHQAHYLRMAKLVSGASFPQVWQADHRQDYASRYRVLDALAAGARISFNRQR